jgi:hypothetical protein
LAEDKIDEATQFSNLIKERFKESIQNDPEIKLSINMVELRNLIKGKLFIIKIVGDLMELEKKYKENPKDLNIKYEYAGTLFIKKPGLDDKKISINLLLEILKADLSWEGQKAKHLILKMFEVLGSDSPITKSGRSKLASLLFK